MPQKQPAVWSENVQRSTVNGGHPPHHLTNESKLAREIGSFPQTDGPAPHTCIQLGFTSHRISTRSPAPPQVRAASVGTIGDAYYFDWPRGQEMTEYVTNPEGLEPFTVDTYCEEALMDRRGSLQISRYGAKAWVAAWVWLEGGFGL